MSTSIYGQNLSYVDNETLYTGAEIARQHGLTDQMIGLFATLGPGVLNGLAVSAGTGLNATVAAGEAIGPQAAYRGVYYRTTAPVTVALEASSDSYIYAAYDSVGQSETNATPAMVASPLGIYANGLPLALVRTSGSAVTEIIDLRTVLAWPDEFGEDTANTVGLTVAFLGGRLRNSAGAIVTVAPFTVTLTASDNQYVEIDDTGAPNLRHGAFSASGYKPLWSAVTDDSFIVTAQGQRDQRASLDFTGGGTDSDASTTAKGIAKLSTAPVSGTDPIAVGDNDPRNSNSRAPSGAAGGALTGTYPNPTLATTFATESDFTAHTGAGAPHTAHFDKDGSKALTGNMDAGGHIIGNVAAPTAGNHVTNRDYVDAVAGGVPPSLAVKVVDDTNGPITGLVTIQTVTLLDGDRVLRTGQTTASQNGLWEAHSGAWTRPADFASASNPVVGTNALAVFGDADHSGTRWALVTGSVTVDTTGQVWTRFTGGDGGATPTSLANVGTGAGNWYRDQTGSTANLKRQKAGSTKFTIADGPDEVTNDINEAALVLSNMTAGQLNPTQIAGLASLADSELPIGNGVGTLGTIPASANDGATRYLQQTVPPSGPGVTVWGGPPIVSYFGTSATSLAIGTGSKSLTTQSGLGYSPGQVVTVVNPSTGNSMTGSVASYSGVTLAVNVSKTSGAGTFAVWNINLAPGVALGDIPATRGKVLFDPQVHIEKGRLSADAALTGYSIYFVNSIRTFDIGLMYPKTWGGGSTNSEILDAMTPVPIGATLRGQIQITRPVSEATVTPTGLTYFGVACFDKNGLQINSNGGAVYCFVDGFDCPADGAVYSYDVLFRLPLTHTSFGGSDGKEVAYVKAICHCNHVGSVDPGTTRKATFISGIRVTIVSDTEDSPTLALPDVPEPATTTNLFYSVAPSLAKWSGKFVAMIATTLSASQVVLTDASGFLISVAKGTAFNKNFGTGATDVTAGNDARLSDARTPTAHAASHASGGSDAVSIAASQVTSGVLAMARLATGTPDGTKFVADDGTLKTPAGGGGGGASAFTSLTDVPASYTGKGGQLVEVSMAETALVFVSNAAARLYKYSNFV